MPNTYTTLSALFTAIANAIRGKTGGTGTIVADNFPEAIAGIPVLDTSDANAVAADILTTKSAYVKGVKINGSMPNNGAISSMLLAGTAEVIPAGYTPGGTVSAYPLNIQTAGTASAADIASGKTAWVNGSMLTGTAQAGRTVLFCNSDDDANILLYLDSSIVGSKQYSKFNRIRLVGRNWANVEYAFIFSRTDSSTARQWFYQNDKAYSFGNSGYSVYSNISTSGEYMANSTSTGLGGNMDILILVVMKAGY